MGIGRLHEHLFLFLGDLEKGAAFGAGERGGGDRREPLMAAAGSLLRGGQCGVGGEGGRVGGRPSPPKKGARRKAGKGGRLFGEHGAGEVAVAGIGQENDDGFACHFRALRQL